MLSKGRATLIVIFLFLFVSALQIAASGAETDVPLRANESFTCMAFQGDRMYVGGWHVINYRGVGEVFVYDSNGTQVSAFNMTPPDNAKQYDMQPYGIYANADGTITLMTMDLLQTYRGDGTLLKSMDIRKYRADTVNGKTYYISTGLAGDGQAYYFGDSYGQSVLKVNKDGTLGGRYDGVNVTGDLLFLDGTLYVASGQANATIYLLGTDMKKIAEYPTHLYVDDMGAIGNYLLFADGPRVYVYDRNMTLFQYVKALPDGHQVYGISVYGDKVGFVTMNHQDRTKGGIFLLDGTMFTTKDTPVETKTPDPAPVAGAIVVGASLGFLGPFVGKAQSFLNGLWESLLERLPKAISKFYDAIVGYVKGFFKSKIFKQESKLYKVEAKEHIPLLFGLSAIELLVIAAGSVLLAASYVLAKHASLGLETVALFLISGVVAMTAHDIAHRYFARKYKAVTEYQFWWLGTVIMFVTAIFFGVVYAVPARTIINDSDKLDKKVKGIVYLAGPLVSFAFAMFFLLLTALGGTWTKVGLLGVSMNLLSSVYGLMPFNPMDGKKVFDWKSAVWAVAFLPVLAAYVLVTIFMA